jgi:hypothetical protein
MRARCPSLPARLPETMPACGRRLCRRAVLLGVVAMGLPIRRNSVVPILVMECCPSSLALRPPAQELQVRAVEPLAAVPIRFAMERPSRRLSRLQASPILMIWRPVLWRLVFPSLLERVWVARQPDPMPVLLEERLARDFPSRAVC